MRFDPFSARRITLTMSCHAEQKKAKAATMRYRWRDYSHLGDHPAISGSYNDAILSNDSFRNELGLFSK
jgi:hypothetical protein